MTQTEQPITDKSTIPCSAIYIRVEPISAVTDIILQAGNTDLQILSIINQQRRQECSLTFAEAGISNVFEGETTTIAAMTAQIFVWRSEPARWFLQSKMNQWIMYPLEDEPARERALSIVMNGAGGHS